LNVTGHIKYFDATRINAAGEPVKMSNVVCLHEQDAGIGWKHTNHRNGIASVVRNRQLVVQTICTLANYEYIIAYIFDQSGAVHTELRATGILSTVPIAPGIDNPWSSTVAHGVAAPYHQHLFSLRIDPAIDGRKNTVVYEDSVPMPVDETNPYKIGYVTEKTRIATSQGFDDSLERGRVVKIENTNRTNAVSLRPMAYKLHAHRSQMLLMHPESINASRAGFATKPFWVTGYRDGELYAAGRWTNQSRSASGGVDDMVKRKDATENEDVVLWHTFGLTHNPRPEDFPVMV
jgi:primary-amine oxidase